MNRIQKLFQKKKEKLIIFLTAGYPEKKDTIELIQAAEKADVDMIEIGMPFSDPLAEGPTIQKSSKKAIENGVTLSWILKQIKNLRKKSEIPLALMGYTNPILKYGLNRFIEDCAKVGVDGLILADLPFDESEKFCQKCTENLISPILLVAPNTPGEQITKISERAGDLIYCVSILGVTGTKSADNFQLQDYLMKVKKYSKTPFIVGFGLKSRKDVKKINALSDGAVIGSSIIKKLEKASNSILSIQTYLHQLKPK